LSDNSYHLSPQKEDSDMTRTFEYRTEDAKRFIEDWYKTTLDRWPASFKEHYLETSFGKTYVIEGGDESLPTLAMMHGGGMNSSLWVDVVDLKEISETYHFFAVDLIGEAGRSIANQRPKSAGIYPDWLEEVFDGLHIERPTLLGGSLGATISLFSAYARPALVRDVVTFAPPSVVCKMKIGTALKLLSIVLFTSRKRFLGFCRYLEGGEIDEEKGKNILDFVWGQIQHKHRTMVAMPPALNDKQLASIEVPCLVYLSENDGLYDAWKVKRRLDSLDCAVKAEVLPGVGHFCDFDFWHSIKAGLEASRRRPDTT
jgi:pimeloyl-ACP methyl ester carboxylesterase